jgi:PAS domain S-box-containing protein
VPGVYNIVCREGLGIAMGISKPDNKPSEEAPSPVLGQSEEAPTDALAYVNSIVDTVRESLVILGGRLRVLSANRAFYRTFRVSPQETEGQLLYDLGNGQWDIPRLRILLEEILPQNTSFDDYEVEHDFPDVGSKVMLLNARKLRLEGAELILLAIEDVTERRRAEAERQEIETRFTSLVKNIKDHSIFTLDPEGRVTSWNIAAEHVLRYTEADVLGRDFSFIFTPEDRSLGLPEAELRAARLHGRAEDERWHLRKGGQRFWALGIVSALHDAEGRLTGFSKILRDRTEWKLAEEAAREVNRRKDRFLATLAHELRNPLAPIRTSLDVLQQLGGGESGCAEPLRIMDRQLNHLVRLVDDLMDISRISRGKIALRKERLDLAEIIQTALEMNERVIDRDDRSLTVSVAASPLPVEGDRVRLVQVVSNLLNNAAKFTDQDGEILLRAEPRGDRVEIQVQDDGRGIPRDQLGEIFEPFAQAEPGRGGGLGIGLALVQRLVGMHGGTVIAESGGPGCGATFTVSLPLCRGGSAQPDTNEAAKAEPMPGRRVLVVDDNPDVAEALRILLTMLNAGVRIAHDGAEAVQICEAWQPTHILMDLGMPGMDGYEAARRLRAKHPAPTFRLVALSGWCGEQERKRSREAGFDAHLVKPVGVAELEDVISHAVPVQASGQGTTDA